MGGEDFGSRIREGCLLDAAWLQRMLSRQSELEDELLEHHYRTGLALMEQKHLTSKVINNLLAHHVDDGASTEKPFSSSDAYELLNTKEEEVAPALVVQHDRLKKQFDNSYRESLHKRANLEDGTARLCKQEESLEARVEHLQRELLLLKEQYEKAQVEEQDLKQTSDEKDALRKEKEKDLKYCLIFTLSAISFCVGVGIIFDKLGW